MFPRNQTELLDHWTRRNMVGAPLLGPCGAFAVEGPLFKSNGKVVVVRLAPYAGDKAVPRFVVLAGPVPAFKGARRRKVLDACRNAGILLYAPPLLTLPHLLAERLRAEALAAVTVAAAFRRAGSLYPEARTKLPDYRRLLDMALPEPSDLRRELLLSA